MVNYLEIGYLTLGSLKSPGLVFLELEKIYSGVFVFNRLMKDHVMKLALTKLIVLTERGWGTVL